MIWKDLNDDLAVQAHYREANPEVWQRPMEQVARRVASLWQPCPDCGGHGHEPCGGCCDGDIDPCSRCGGSGIVPSGETWQAMFDAAKAGERFHEHLARYLFGGER